jgi:hypothetical protein
MAGPSVTYTFTNATTADGTQVSQNFTDLINGLTDGTKDLNINALTAAGKTTLNGAVDLGNATGDAITVNGLFAGTGGDAGAAQRGLVNIGAQTFTGVKTFDDAPVFNDGIYLDDTGGVQNPLNHYEINALSVIGGDFTAGTVRYTKLGRVVTLTALDLWDHNAVVAPTTAVILPANLRPAIGPVTVVYQVGGFVRMFSVLTSGALTTSYFDWAGTTVSSVTNIGTICTIQYNLAS